MSKSDTFETDILSLIFNGTTITGLADNTATSPLGSLYAALHTADPGDAGNQSTSEVAYTGYARVAIPRTTAGFTVASASGVGTATLASDRPFPSSTSAGGTAAYWSIGTAAAGTGKILYSGPLNPTVACVNGVQPILKAGTTVTED